MRHHKIRWQRRDETPDWAETRRRLTAGSASDWRRARLKIGEPLAHLARPRQIALPLVPIESIDQRRGGFLGATGRVQHLGGAQAVGSKRPLTIASIALG